MLEDIIKNYGLIPTIVCLFVSWYLRGYFTEKSKNLATHEDFTRILKQTERTTQVTEEIKANIAYGNWMNQQHWGVKEKIYTDILSNLTIMEISYIDRLDYYIRPESEHDMSIPGKKRYQLLAKNEVEALRSIRELIGPAALFISESTIAVIKKLYGDSWLSEQAGDHPKEYLEWMLKSTKDAYAIVLSDAKRDICNKCPAK